MVYKLSYLDWLKLRIEYFDGLPHNHLLNILHSIEYVPVMLMDLNRYNDGIAIRNDYFTAFGEDSNIIDSPCSFLEFLYALARRMNYIYAMVDEDRTQDCFWTLINNMGLGQIDDSTPNIDDQYVHSCVDKIIHRRFKKDGSDGLFPLDNPRTNQRNVDIWSQMNQYLTEVMTKEGRL